MASPSKKPDIPKQTKAIRIHEPLRMPAQALADRRARTVTQLVNDLLLQALEQSGYWPTEELAKRHQEIIEALRHQRGG